MRKLILMFFCSFMSLLLGCAGDQEEQAVKIVRVGYVSGPTELVHRGAEVFAQKVAEKSEGRIRVKLYPSGQLGDDRVLAEGLQLRSVDFILTGCAIIGWYTPEYTVAEAPFVWRDYEHIEKAWNGAIGEEIREAMRKKNGIEIMYLWMRGPRYLTSTSEPIRNPDDLDGFKLRVPELEIYMKSWQAFGANTTPIPFTDMFMALRLGVVEGQENPLGTIYGNHLHEVQRYIMETKHLISFYLFCAGPHFLTHFTPEEQKILLEAAREATEWHNAEVESAETDYRKKLEESGVEFIDVDRDAFRKRALERIPPVFKDVWKQGIYERILEVE